MGIRAPDLDLQQKIDSAPALIHTGLPDGYLDFFDQTWLSYVGRSLEELQGWNWTACIHPEDCEAMVQAWRMALASGEPFLHEARVRRADGTFRSMLHHKVPLRNEHGSIVKWYGSSYDIEDRKRGEERLRESEERYRALIADLRRSETFLMEAQRLSHTGSWREELKSGAMYWSPEYYQIMGFDPALSAPPVGWSWQRVHPEDLKRIRRVIGSAMREKRDAEYENRIIRPDGAVRTIVSVVHPILDASGEIVEVMGTCTDISERRAAEAEVRKQAELLSLTHDALIVRDHDGLIRFWNRGAEELYGWTATEALGQRTHELLRTEFPAPQEEIESITCEQGRWEGELVHVRRDGAQIVVSSRWSQQRDEGDRPVAILETNTDITAQKRADEELRKSEERYRALIEVSPQMVWTTPAEGWALFANQWWYEYTGLTDPATQGFEPIHPDHKRRMWKSWRETVAAEREWIEEAPLRRAADGQYRWHLLRGRAMRDAGGKIIRWIGIAIDIHDRREAEEALRESERESRVIVDTIPGLVATLTPAGEVDVVNDQVLAYCGRTMEELKRWGTGDTVHPEDLPRAAEIISRSMVSGDPYEIEERIRRFDGAYRWFHVRGLPLRDSDGHIVRWYVLMIDIHDRKEAEETLKRREAWLSEAQRMSHTGSWAQDLRTGGVYGSQELLRIVDVKAGVTLTDVIMSRVHPEDRWIAIEETEKAIRDKTDSIGEFRFLLPDGTIRHVQYAVHPVLDATGDLVELIGTIMDVTDRKRAEEALRQTQAALAHVTRVSTVGEVSASIAHELNQPLGAIANNASACQGLLSSAAPDLDEVRAALADIVGDAERASAIIERVRALARRSAPERIPVRLADLVRDVAALVRAESANRRVAVRIDVSEDLPLVLGDRVELHQVLLNFVVNGMDAMSGIGSSHRMLEIRGALDELDGCPAARISVEDHGVGLRGEPSDRLFEPFYTTKAHGMGLGLAISRSIIEAHGGRLWAEDNPGPGATFSFALPAAEQRSPAWLLRRQGDAT